MKTFCLQKIKFLDMILVIHFLFLFYLFIGILIRTFITSHCIDWSKWWWSHCFQIFKNLSPILWLPFQIFGISCITFIYCLFNISRRCFSFMSLFYFICCLQFFCWIWFFIIFWNISFGVYIDSFSSILEIWFCTSINIWFLIFIIFYFNVTSSFSWGILKWF